MQVNPWALAAVTCVVLVLFTLGHRSARSASTTQDFLRARRTVRSRRNAAAVSGEYLSAASFLGVAGVVLTDGVDALWYPIGFTAGYLVLTLFVVAPLRRSGAYTLPDFAESRLDSPRLRTLATWCVVLVGVVYLVPQLQGAGIALGTMLPTPTWVGAVVVAALVGFHVFAGGMRAVTVVQAFQYWLKLVTIAAPAFVLCGVFLTSGAGGGEYGPLGKPAPPVFHESTTVRVDTPVTLTVVEPTGLRASGTVDGAPAHGAVYWSPSVSHEVAAGTTLWFAEDTQVPVVESSEVRDSNWLTPGDDGLGGTLRTYSLLTALCLGTMGLPHVLVRFYTNPDGRAARRTTVHVLLLLGLFYLFPVLFGALSRMYVPELLLTGESDAAVLALPTAVLPGIGGQLLAAVTAAGAFAAFLATSAGILTSVAGVVATDLLPGRARDFRMAAGLAGVVALGLAIVLRPAGLSVTVAMAFALAASTFSPLLLLGVWWRRLTWQGAMAGMLVGGVLVSAALVVNVGYNLTGASAPWYTLQPALVTVPAASLVTVVGSLVSRGGVPEGTSRLMLRMHAPDVFGLGQERRNHQTDTVAAERPADEVERLRRGRHRKPTREGD